MTIRAKFKVHSVTSQTGHGKHDVLHSIKLLPVTGGSEENEAFYAATPGGLIDLQVVPESIGAQFNIGQEFYVDFTPCYATAND